MPRSLLSARAFFREPVAYVRAQDGDGAVLRTAGPGRFTLVREPEAIWDVLVTDAQTFRPGKWKVRARRFIGPTLNTLDGEEHRRRRVLVQPALDRRRIQLLGPAIAVRAEASQASLGDGARVPLRDVLDRLSLLVAGDVLLSTDLEPDATEPVESLRSVMAGVPRLAPPLHGTPQGRALAEVALRVDRVIDERRRAPRADGDLSAALLAGGLPEGTVRGEVIAFLLAAVDEPPSALEAAWWLLGRDPAAERRFHSEVDRDPPGPYVGAVLQETLRLFPPARHIDRCPIADTHIGGERVRAGTNVLISPLVTHREAHLYEQPDDFRPERWLGPRGERPRGAYIPFGAGPHTGIGEPLARAIATAALAAVGRHWRLRVDADAPPPAPGAPRLVVTVERR